MSIFSVINKLDEISEVEELVHVLHDVNRSRKVGTMDAVSGIRMRKSVIDSFINKIEGDTRQCIETQRDLFHLWLYDKVSVYRISDGNAVCGRKTEPTANEVCTSNAGSVASTDEEEENLKMANQSNDVKQVIKATKNLDIVNRKGQFSQHLSEFDITTRIQNMPNAVTAFTERFHCVRGKKYGIKTRDRIRDVRLNEKAASYYCLCGTKDEVYFQFRHHQVTDVISSGNEKKYVFRCFVKPEHAVIVQRHFQPFVNEPVEYDIPIRSLNSTITNVEVTRNTGVKTKTGRETPKNTIFGHVEPSILTPVTAATNTVISVGNRIGELKVNSMEIKNKKRLIQGEENMDDILESLIGQDDIENQKQKGRNTNYNPDRFEEQLNNIESLLISKGLLGEKTTNSLSDIVIGNYTKRTRRDVDHDAAGYATEETKGDKVSQEPTPTVDKHNKEESNHNTSSIAHVDDEMSSKNTVDMNDESNDSDGNYSEENDDATRKAFIKMQQLFTGPSINNAT
jgi:hypothetical protein